MSDVLQNLQKLPPECASINLVSGDPMIIKRGEMGYYPAPALRDERGVDRFNEKRGVSPAQKEAMELGSCFGWEVPGADPDNHEKAG